MGSNTVYILHKNGADSHYSGLHYLLKNKDFKLVFREFSVAGKLFKALFSFNFHLFRKQLINLWFLISLLFTKNKKIVLGIAPFDSKIILLLRILKNHKLYYHTSWTCWDGTFQPKSRNMTAEVLETWRRFLYERTEHIFAVTNTSKKEIQRNYALSSSKISVVYHSLDPIFAGRRKEEKRRNSFIYLGRLVPQKGLAEVLNFFSKNRKATLTIIGSGNEKPLVQKYMEENHNIFFHEHISDKEELKKKISEHEYLVLNSKKTPKWEELFGLVIIECMSQGVIPVASNHSGPKEIISAETGILFEEGKIAEVLSELIIKNFDTKMSRQAELKSKLYLPEKVAPRWKQIL